MSSDEENSQNSKGDRSDDLEELLSMERLDRASPELWPEKKLGTLTPSALALDLKKIYDQAYVLGVQEAKEMTRGKYLNIFGYDINKSLQQQSPSKGFPSTTLRKSSTSSE
ncbi:protein lin-52 homolog isoform X3 [Phlebotomus papatasi]|uniref:protein lin-52 homolog isoform X3 n=1 Tax=Phlebotomus papatasi TaxID=29031 RepID=UPI002483F3E4|nr:protein lin-52 homolog isoform X3 [Phlebotomus papatasi]